MGAILCHMGPTVVGASTSAALPSTQHWNTREKRGIDTEDTGGWEGGGGGGEKGVQRGRQFQQVSWMLGSKKSGNTNST